MRGHAVLSCLSCLWEIPHGTSRPPIVPNTECIDLLISLSCVWIHGIDWIQWFCVLSSTFISDLALVCGLMEVDVSQRMTFEQAMQHPWVRRCFILLPFSNNRPNRMLTDGGYLADPLSLAQRLMERLQVNLSEDYGDPSAEMLVSSFAISHN